MKLNMKLLSKVLIIPFIFNNIYINSNAALSERYEELNGNYITINNSVKGEVNEIEIFGDTWQDANSPNIFDGLLEEGFYDPFNNGKHSDSEVMGRSINYTPYEGVFVSNKSLTVLFFDCDFNYLEYTQLSPYKTNNAKIF